MNNEKELILEAMQKLGKTIALQVQSQSSTMTGTELNEEKGYIPDFLIAKAKQNMLERKAGQEDGFVCRSTAGRVVRLIQNYDSDTYSQEPEELPAQWRFVWSTNPKHALPFISLATSPYAIGDCCSYEDHVWRSGQDNNIWPPNTVGVTWEDLGTIENVMNGVIITPEESDEPDESGQDNEVITAERGMEYVYGQIYLDPEDNKTYICQRDNEAEGGKVVLHFLPHELIGHYFQPYDN